MPNFLSSYLMSLKNWLNLIMVHSLFEKLPGIFASVV